MGVTVFGIRHHGPGCARSLRLALERLEPDIVLVEGPPDAQDVLPLLSSQEMKPPVALLIYTPDMPNHAVYYPFVSFSPEWQALSYAFGRSIPARFMDLPQALQLGQAQEEQPAEPEKPLENPTGDKVSSSQLVHNSVELELPETEENKAEELIDPLDMLARAAGYSDAELWWERQIEQRRDMNNFFESILEAMSELRSDPAPKNEREAQREAYMRQTIRTAQKEGFQRIAVICGAFHAPVLTEAFLAKSKGDASILRGLKRVKVEATWIPWTYSRLSSRSGYGAGVTSPGWYDHLWNAPDHASIRWATTAARLLRASGLDASSASVIETVRLADALSAMRDLPMPGLAEMHEAILTVLCHGNTEPMALIRQQLEIGDRLGEVPAETPAVPLQRDLERKQRELRFKPTTAIETLDLDLRKENDRARSRLLHRLTLLNIPWGKVQRGSRRQQGTFHELWQTQWQVEFVIKVIEMNVWGNTVETASSAYASHLADQADNLPALTELLHAVLLAELPQAIEHLLQTVQAQAAVAADVHHMLAALPSLVEVARYSDVRETRSELLLPVIAGLFERAVIGLPGACASLDDDAARAMVKSINSTHEALYLLDRQDFLLDWKRVLHQLMNSEGIHALVRGRCSRLLFDKQAIDAEELQRHARLALNAVVPPAQVAAWVEGVLAGGGHSLLLQEGLWLALDLWLSELQAESFVELLPMLRRAFADFSAPERRSMGEKVVHLHKAPGTVKRESEQVEIDHERASSVLPVLAQLLGVKI